MTASRRIESVDIMRGMTIVLMILVNNAGDWESFPSPLHHAEWNGLTFADLVFPFFLFIMGVSIYLSLSKGGFSLNIKILRRTLLLFSLGLLIGVAGQLVYSPGLSLAEALRNIRIPGVLQRIAVCYGIGALVACTVSRRGIVWIVAAILSGYALLLCFGDGYLQDDPSNILSKVDVAVLGNHIYSYSPLLDPEGILSTIPSIAHTLIGFLVGGLILEGRKERVLLAGGAMAAIGIGFSFLLPVNKTIWSPTFVLVTCGLASVLLALLYYFTDYRQDLRHNGFFKAFGCNAIFCYILADVLGWAAHLSGARVAFMDAVGHGSVQSVIWPLIVILATFLIAWPLYKKKIYIKL